MLFKSFALKMVLRQKRTIQLKELIGCTNLDIKRMDLLDLENLLTIVMRLVMLLLVLNVSH